MKFALMFKGDSSDICKDYQQTLVRHAIEKVKSKRLYLQPDWESALKVYYGQKFDDTIKQWKLEEEETKLLQDIAESHKSAPVAQNKAGQSKFVISKKPLYDFDNGKVT